jgi:hypothetical protein
MHMLNSMRIKASTNAVMAALVKNRSAHAAIVKEARQGYVSKAQMVLTQKLSELAAGKVVALSFSLRVPVDQTKVYDTAIEMMRLHTEETVELDAGQVRNLMLDEWDWTDQFYATNSMYSGMAASRVGASQDDEE